VEERETKKKEKEKEKEGYQFLREPFVARRQV
jgi:hypothetical protein